MKTFKTLTLAVATGLVGGLLTAGAAIAAPWVHHGSICHNYNPGQANDFDFYVGDGTKNAATSVRYAICPFVSTQTPGKTLGSVTVQFSNTSGASISCWVYTYDWNDTWKGTNPVSLPNGGSIATASNVPDGFYYRHSLLCALPANRTGAINGIESNF